MTQRYIFPLRHAAAGGIPEVTYWWSNLNEAPYITGQRKKDWGGPYASLEEASAELVSYFPGMPFEILGELTEIDVPHVFWSSYFLSGIVSFVIPLDEFSERCLVQDSSRERKNLWEEMTLDARMRPGLYVAGLHLMYAGKKRGNFSVVKKIRDDQVYCRQKVTLSLRCRDDLSRYLLDSILEPVIDLGDRYSEVLEPTLRIKQD